MAQAKGLARTMPPFTLIALVALLLLSLSSSTSAWMPSGGLSVGKYLSGSAAPDIARLPPPARPSAPERNFFAAAKQQLALAESHSTCKRRATVKLLASCEHLEASPAEDVELETLQNFYAAHLALCELEGAYPKLRSQCRLSLPAYADEAPPLLRDVAEVELRRCLGVIKTNENYWTSYSNNRRDAYVWCRAMRPGFDQGDYFKSLKNVVMTNEELAQELKEYLGSMKQELRDQRDFAAMVAQLRENVTLDVRQSGQEASSMIQWAIKQGENALAAFLETLTATTQRATAEAVSLAETLHDGAGEAHRLNAAVAKTGATVVAGVESISLAQARQWNATAELAAQVQRQLESLVDAKIAGALEQAALQIAEISTKMQRFEGSLQAATYGVNSLSLEAEKAVDALSVLAPWIERSWAGAVGVFVYVGIALGLNLGLGLSVGQSILICVLGIFVLPASATSFFATASAAIATHWQLLRPLLLVALAAVVARAVVRRARSASFDRHLNVIKRLSQPRQRDRRIPMGDEEKVLATLSPPVIPPSSLTLLSRVTPPSPPSRRQYDRSARSQTTPPTF